MKKSTRWALGLFGLTAAVGLGILIVYKLRQKGEVEKAETATSEAAAGTENPKPDPPLREPTEK